MKIDFPSEKFIEDYVWAELQEHRVCPISGESFDFSCRQRKIHGYGVTDIIKIDYDEESVRIVILELKNEILKESHLSQLLRYMRGVKRIVNRYISSKKLNFEITVTGELAGPFDPDSNDLVYLLEEIDSIEIYDLSVDLRNGFSAKEINRGWYHKGESYISQRDISRQVFNGVCLIREFMRKEREGIKNAQS